MGDFSFLIETVAQLRKELVTTAALSTEKDHYDRLLSTVESQITNLQAYIENESRKKVEYHERIQVLESQYEEEKAKR